MNPSGYKSKPITDFDKKPFTYGYPTTSMKYDNEKMNIEYRKPSPLPFNSTNVINDIKI